MHVAAVVAVVAVVAMVGVVATVAMVASIDVIAVVALAIDRSADRSDARQRQKADAEKVVTMASKP